MSIMSTLFLEPKNLYLYNREIDINIAINKDMCPCLMLTKSKTFINANLEIGSSSLKNETKNV